MKHHFLLTASLFLGLEFGGVASDLFASAVDDVRLLNEQMSDARQQGQSIYPLANTASALLSGKTSRLNLERYANDTDRDIAWDAIFNKVIGGFHQGQSRFSLKERSQTNDSLDPRYVAHMGFMALNHLATLNLVTQKAGFLYDQNDCIHTLSENRLTLFDQYIKVKNRALFQALRTLIAGYSDELITRILGNRVQDRYLGLCRNFPDIKAQWLIQVKDIKEKRLPGIISHTDLNQDKYRDEIGQLIAIELKDGDGAIPVSFFEQCVQHKGHYLISSEKAFKTFENLSKQQNSWAQFNVAIMYYNGDGIAKFLSQDERDKQAFGWFKKAANQNFAIAQNNFAFMYFKGVGTKKSWQKALGLYKKSVSNGLNESHIHINIAVLERFFKTLKSKDLLVDAIATQLTQQQCFDFCRGCGIGHFVVFNRLEDYKTIFINSNAISEKEAVLPTIKNLYLLGIKKEDGQLNNSLYSVIGKYMATVNNRLTDNGQLNLDADDVSQVDALFDFFIQERLLTPAEAGLYREDLFPSG